VVGDEHRSGAAVARLLGRVGAIACAAAIALALPSARSGESSGSVRRLHGVGEVAPGFRVYRDPVTGRFGEPPPDGALAGAAAAGPGTRLAPLRQRRSPVPGGGVIADLGGRFQSVVRATAQPGGPEVRCDGPIADGAGR
jgi:hypothetical protein